MASPTTSSSLPVSPSTIAKSEKAYRSYQAHTYPKQLWYFLVSFIFFIGLCQFTSFILAKYSKRRRTRSPPVDVENRQGATKHVVSLRRIPSALVNLFRIIAFRSTVHFGAGYSLNLAEVALTCIYIVALFVWTFINCKPAIQLHEPPR